MRSRIWLGLRGWSMPSGMGERVVSLMSSISLRMSVSFSLAVCRTTRSSSWLMTRPLRTRPSAVRRTDMRKSLFTTALGSTMFDEQVVEVVAAGAGEVGGDGAAGAEQAVAVGAGGLEDGAA